MKILFVILNMLQYKEQRLIVRESVKKKTCASGVKQKFTLKNSNVLDKFDAIRFRSFYDVASPHAPHHQGEATSV